MTNAPCLTRIVELAEMIKQVSQMDVGVRKSHASS
jgi:hypothetical protein